VEGGVAGEEATGDGVFISGLVGVAVVVVGVASVEVVDEVLARGTGALLHCFSKNFFLVSSRSANFRACKLACRSEGSGENAELVGFLGRGAEAPLPANCF